MTREPAEDVVVETDLEAPPETVWRALTEPALVAAWLAPTDILPEEGARFRLGSMPDAGGAVECEVLSADPPHEIRYSWRDADMDPRDPASEVAFVLTPTRDGGTFLRVVHSGLTRVVAAPAPASTPANDTHETVMRMAA